MKRARDELEDDDVEATTSWNGWGGWSSGESDAAAELTRQIGAHALEKRLPAARLRGGVHGPECGSEAPRLGCESLLCFG